MSAFGAALVNFAQVPVDATQWQAFLTAIGTAYQTDVETTRIVAVRAAAQGQSPQARKPVILDSNYRPERFSDDRDPKATLTFKQWSSDVRSVLKRYNKKHTTLMDIAVDGNAWNEQDAINEVEHEGFGKEDYVLANEEVFEILKTVTTGDA